MSESELFLPDARIITYRDFLATGGEVERGTIVSQVKPQDLWTLQDWIDRQKVTKALRSLEEGIYRLSVGYPLMVPNIGLRLVLGDGNHNALAKHSVGLRVDVVVTPYVGKPNPRIRPFMRLAKDNAELFRI